jgi:hypothetical protein
VQHSVRLLEGQEARLLDTVLDEWQIGLPRSRLWEMPSECQLLSRVKDRDAEAEAVRQMVGLIDLQRDRPGVGGGTGNGETAFVLSPVEFTQHGPGRAAIGGIDADALIRHVVQQRGHGLQRPVLAGFGGLCCPEVLDEDCGRISRR